MSKVILLVEDNESDELLTVRAFKKSNTANDVLVVRDGAEALDYVFHTGAFESAAPPLPTVMLLDLNLPKVSGLEVLRRIRADERTKLLPVVVLTGTSEEEDIVRSYALGANAYVRKPVDFGEFMKAAETLGLFWLLLNETPTGREPAPPAK